MLPEISELESKKIQGQKYKRKNVKKTTGYLVFGHHRWCEFEEKKEKKDTVMFRG
jgi:hypothetical protein